MLGESHLWPAGDAWTLHAGGGPFKSLAIFDEALAHRYGAPRSLVDYAAKAQLSAYESERAMFEAYSERKYRATGVVKWMLNNAWPSLIWHLWDHYLRPGGGYFGAKKACEPLHVQYSPGTHAVVVVSELWQRFDEVAVDASVHDLDSRELWRARRTVDVPEDGVVRALGLPERGDLPALVFLKLSLTLKGERFPRSSNFYWLPREPDTLDHENASWITTPVRSYADLRGLEALAPATLLARAERTRVEDGELEFRVTLENPGRTLAFFNRLRLLCDGTEVLPVLWDENFVSLLPGESLVVSARASGARSDSLTVEVSGRNSARLNATM
jgi:exo-1,4-beta-D-glucosaminidase